jgi:Ca-activated chloride channel homolog
MNPKRWYTILRMTRGCSILFVFVSGLAQSLAQEVAIVPHVPSARSQVLPPVDAQPVLRVESSLVLVPTHVTNATGFPVNDLTRDNFRLYEDDVEQTIASFSAEDVPVSVALLFDASGSMRNKMDKAYEAADHFFSTANADDEFSLIEINGRAKLVEPFTRNANQLLDRIRRIRPGGQTPLFDAIHVAIKEMKSAHNSRKALVILSDGGDNWSTHTYRQVRGALLESDAQVYAIGIFDEDFTRNHSPEEAKGPMVLDDLTSHTGGRLYRAGNLDELPEIGSRISRELRQQYVLGYYSNNAVRDGKYRRVKVRISSDLPELRVSFRTGYYAPSE